MTVEWGEKKQVQGREGGGKGGGQGVERKKREGARLAQ